MQHANPELMEIELRQQLAQAVDFGLGIGADALETYFLSCNGTESFAGFIQALIETSFWQRKRQAGGALPEICIQLARDIDASSQNSPEPAYHSRRHFKEVCLALSLLLGVVSDTNGPAADQFAWPLSEEDCWILLLAAIGHDFGHEGRPNRYLGEQEEKACLLLEAFTKAHVALSAEQLLRLQMLIRATEPSLFKELTARIQPSMAIQHIDMMKVLLVEADLFASMLPSYGARLGVSLAEEFAAHDAALAQLIASPEGRKGFLQSHPYVSPNSQRLRFNELIRTAIIQIQH